VPFDCLALAVDLLVVDASVVVKYILGADGLKPLHRFALHAPTVLWSEVGSALSQLRMRSDIDEANVQGALDRLSAAKIEAHHSADLVRGAIALARRLGWAKTYDAEYVVLAQSLGARFTTADAKLSRSVTNTIELLDPATFDRD
jgi:predicted nucleic acid-binding protein